MNEGMNEFFLNELKNERTNEGTLSSSRDK